MQFVETDYLFRNYAYNLHYMQWYSTENINEAIADENFKIR